MISPIHPTMPLIDTAADVSIEEHMITIVFILEVSIPRDVASSSPNEITFICHLSKIKGTMLMIIGKIIVFKSLKVTEDNPPNSQKVIAGSLLSASATYFVIDIKAVNRFETTIPINTRTTTELFPWLTILPIKYVKVTAANPNANDENCIVTMLNDKRIANADPSLHQQKHLVYQEIPVYS